MLRNQFGQAPQQRSAFTLLEIAIALAIFVIGALAVIRIFPTALGVIHASGDKQGALSMNQALLARFNADSNSVPYSVYNLNTTGSTWEDFDGAVLASGHFGKSLPIVPQPTPPSNFPDSPINVRNSSLGHYQAIGGEQTVVKTDTTTGNLFVLSQFPLSTDSAYVSVYERADVDGVTINQNGMLDFRNAKLASNQESIGLPPNPASYDVGTLPIASLRYPAGSQGNAIFHPVTFYVSYKYQLGGFLSGVDEEPVIISDTATPPATVHQSTGVIPGTVTVSLRRRVALLPVIPASPTTPDWANARRGLIEGLSGDMVSKATPGPLAAGDQVELDYQADWTWLLQEGTPNLLPPQTSFESTTTNPTPGPSPTPGGSVSSPIRQLPLTAPYIQDRSDVGGVSFAALVLPSDSNATSVSVQKSEYGDSGLYAEPGTTNQLVIPTDSGDFLDDLRASRLSFDLSGTANPRVRVAYRNRDSWAQQFTVAAKSYKPYPGNNNIENEPWRDYRIISTGNGLQFHAGEAGKTILISYTYNDGTATTTLIDQLLPIEKDLYPAASGDAFAPSGSVAQVTLRDKAGNPLGANQLKAILTVRGASINVRTAYLNSTRYSQSYLTSMRGGIGATS